MCQYPRDMHRSARGAQEPRALLFVRVHITPRPRQALRAAASLATDDLIDRHVVALERVGAAREVHAPDAELLVIDELLRYFSPGLEVLRPDVERMRIVTAQALDVQGLDAAALHGFEHETDM